MEIRDLGLGVRKFGIRVLYKNSHNLRIPNPELQVPNPQSPNLRIPIHFLPQRTCNGNTRIQFKTNQNKGKIHLHPQQ